MYTKTPVINTHTHTHTQEKKEREREREREREMLGTDTRSFCAEKIF